MKFAYYEKKHQLLNRLTQYQIDEICWKGLYIEKVILCLTENFQLG